MECQFAVSGHTLDRSCQHRRGSVPFDDSGLVLRACLGTVSPEARRATERASRPIMFPWAIEVGGDASWVKGVSEVGLY